MPQKMPLRVLRSEAAEMRTDPEIGDGTVFDRARGDVEAADQHEAAAVQQVAQYALEAGREQRQAEAVRRDLPHGAASSLVGGDGGVDLGAFGG